MRWLPCLLGLFLLAACASDNRDTERSEFFSEVFPLRQSVEHPDEYSYVASRVDFKNYTEIYVAPVTVYDDEDGLQMPKAMQDQIQENYRLQLILILREKGYDVVYHPQPGTLELNAAVTSIRLANDGFELSDLFWPTFGDDTSSSSYTSTAHGNQHHVEVRGEAFLYDSRAGVTVAQFVSVKKGATSAGDNNEITYSEVRPVIEEWTERAGAWTCSLLQ